MDATQVDEGQKCAEDLRANEGSNRECKGAEMTTKTVPVEPTEEISSEEAYAALSAAQVRLEAPTAQGEPFCYVLPGEDMANDAGFIDARIWKEGEFTRPLYAAPIPRPTCGEKEKEIQNLCSVEAELDTACKANAALEATIAQQAEEIARLTKDAERYRWIRRCPVKAHHLLDIGARNEELDVSIDTVIGKKS